MFPFDGVIMIILISRNIEKNKAVHIAAVQLYAYNETKRQSRSKKLGVKRNNWHHCIDHQISSYRKVICQLTTSKEGSKTVIVMISLRECYLKAFILRAKR